MVTMLARVNGQPREAAATWSMVWSILARVHGTAPEVAPYPDEQSSVGSSQHSSITPPIQPVCIAIISLQGGTAWATADAGTDTRAAATTSHFIFRPQGGTSGSRAPARLGRSAIARGDHRPRARVPIPPAAALFFCLRRQRCCAPLLSHGCSSRTRSPAAGGARPRADLGFFWPRVRGVSVAVGDRQAREV
jgi:hypothetical protein